jgi:GNAT superfamily N-acetyltransferase
MRRPETQLIVPRSPAELDATRAIFREYAASLDIDLNFQGFEAELSALPGDYAAPAGSLLLALVDGDVAGCVAMRPLPGEVDPEGCEMKRLYVRRAYRRFGLGRLLAEQLIAHAREAGHSRMYLDTLDDMEAARGLYAELGFHEVPPYYYNPIPGAHYLCVDLLHTPQA